MAKYLTLAGEYEGQIREYGDIDELNQRKRKLYLIEDYEGYKAKNEMQKYEFLCAAQAERGIQYDPNDKKKAAAMIAANENAKVETPQAELTAESGNATKMDDGAFREGVGKIFDKLKEGDEEKTDSTAGNTKAAETEIDEAAELLKLQKAYKKKEGKDVPSRFKNNADWIKTKLS